MVCLYENELNLHMGQGTMSKRLRQGLGPRFFFKEPARQGARSADGQTDTPHLDRQADRRRTPPGARTHSRDPAGHDKN